MCSSTDRTTRANLIHYGGDNGTPEIYRKGTLHLYHNTIVIRGDEKRRWHTTLLRLETAEETADVRNNVVFRGGTTHLTLMYQTGRALLGTNWVSSGFEPFANAGGAGAQIRGLDKLLTGTASPFVDLPLILICVCVLTAPPGTRARR